MVRPRRDRGRRPAAARGSSARGGVQHHATSTHLLAVVPRLDEALKPRRARACFVARPRWSPTRPFKGASLRAIAPSGAGRALVTLEGAPLNDPFGGWVIWSAVPVESIATSTLCAALALDLMALALDRGHRPPRGPRAGPTHNSALPPVRAAMPAALCLLAARFHFRRPPPSTAMATFRSRRTRRGGYARGVSTALPQVCAG